MSRRTTSSILVLGFVAGAMACGDEFSSGSAGGSGGQAAQGGTAGSGGTAGNGGTAGGGGQLANGSSCSQPEECESSYCVDDVCCDDACSGECVQCDSADALGQCAPAALGTDPRAGCQEGVCDGHGQCASGEHSFGSAIIGTGSATPFALAVDGQGRPVLVGNFNGALGGLDTASPVPDVFVSQFDSNGSLLWSRQFGDHNSAAADDTEEQALDLAIDSNGNLFVAGYYRGQPSQLSGTAPDAGQTQNALVLAYDQTGAFGGGVGFGFATDGDDSTARAVATGPSDEIVVAGIYSGALTAWGTVLPTITTTAPFVAKLSDVSTPIWVKGFAAGSGITNLDVAVAPNGSIWIAGSYLGTPNLGCATLPDTQSVTAPTAFVARLSAVNGDCEWSTSLGEPLIPQSAVAVAAGPQNGVVVAGNFDGTIDLGTRTLTSLGKDVFVVRLDPSGDVVSAASYGNPVNQIARAVAMDSAASILVGGGFDGTFTFGEDGDAITGAGSTDVFVAKLSHQAEHLWSQGFGDVNLQLVTALAVDADDNVWVTGLLDGTLLGFDAGGGAVAAGANPPDMFLLKLSP